MKRKFPKSKNNPMSTVVEIVVQCPLLFSLQIKNCCQKPTSFPEPLPPNGSGDEVFNFSHYFSEPGVLYNNPLRD